jgi:K+-dependent Na+/Ca+ exchanger-like protein
MWLAVWIIVLLCSLALLSEIVDRLFMPSLDRIAQRLNLSESVAWATLLAIGTSMPEISTAMISLLLLGSSPLVWVGTIVGSAIFQILIIIWFIGLIAHSQLHRNAVIRDVVVYMISVLLLYAILWNWQVVWWEALILLLSYGAYLFFLGRWNTHVDEHLENFKSDYETHRAKTWSTWEVMSEKFTRFWNVIFSIFPHIDQKPQRIKPLFVLSLFLIWFCTYWLVLAAESVGIALWIPTIVIALTILAGWSSVPELLSSLTVAKQGRGDMAVADALWSNIFDILVSLWLPLFIYTVWKGTLWWVEASDLTFSMWVLLGMVVLLLISLWLTDFKLNKKLWVVFVWVYILYVLFIVFV